MNKKKNNEKHAHAAAEDVAAEHGTAAPSAAPQQQEADSKVEALTKELSEAKDKYLRLMADYDNYRKRTAKEIASARMTAVEHCLAPFLQVFDHFSMAMAASKNSNNIDALLAGLNMIQSEFSKALNELGVERIESHGQDFDPNLHEAIANEPSEEHGDGKVIRQLSCGYKLEGRLLRPATVVVSSGPPQEETDNATNEEQS
ncbi:MAG: nucleotide exchange factor GrpE [Lentisphaerae bacterium GWF2_52_8]|nr:MAG: nucleotide exchange factor GrpE [Lentisphaerae bacterium GWF2_52_8]